MQCPGCSSHLVTLELSGVEVDFCFSCKGIWLDMGELERLVALDEGDDAFLETLNPVQIREKKRRCPVCRKAMEQVLGGERNSVLLDRCSRHGIWTDEGELRKILRMSSQTRFAGPLVRILDDMFAAQKGGCV